MNSNSKTKRELFWTFMIRKHFFLFSSFQINGIIVKVGLFHCLAWIWNDVFDFAEQRSNLNQKERIRFSSDAQSVGPKNSKLNFSIYFAQLNSSTFQDLKKKSNQLAFGFFPHNKNSPKKAMWLSCLKIFDSLRIIQTKNGFIFVYYTIDSLCLRHNRIFGCLSFLANVCREYFIIFFVCIRLDLTWVGDFLEEARICDSKAEWRGWFQSDQRFIQISRKKTLSGCLSLILTHVLAKAYKVLSFRFVTGLFAD